LKIAINSRMYLEKGTGVPNYIACLYQACLRIDPSNQYVFFQPNRSRTLGDTQIASAPAGLAGAAWFDTVQAQKLTRAHRPDIFHGPSHILPLRKLSGVKYVVTVHDLAFRVLPEQYEWRHRLYYGWQVARSLRMADLVVADSHNTRRDVLRFYPVPPERVAVVHLGVADQFCRAAEARPPRAVTGRYFLSVTTHPRRKNILGALKAFATFAPRTDASYVVAGLMREPQQQEFLALADQLGVRNKVRLFGYADDSQLVSLYQNAEFTLYPSFYEGFGLPVVEAMACGCPVIAANASSLPEIVPDGEWLVDPYDITAMAAKMQQLLALSPEERRRLGERHQHHAKNFTWEKAAGQMIGIFQELHDRKN
jgi:glycosyltransferase involved in cell wall biosynthesis